MAADIEIVYEALARGVDAAGPERAELFLAKAALLLAQALGDPGRAVALVESAGRHLEERAAT